jgi:hypothetical protein
MENQEFDLQEGDIYRHFKGDCYVIITESVDEETGIELVTYARNGKIWTRKKCAFTAYLEDYEWKRNPDDPEEEPKYYTGYRFLLVSKM